MNDFAKIYIPLFGLTLAASGYWYVDAYFSFFGMEEVINELGVNYFIQKSSMVFSTPFTGFIFEADVFIAYLIMVGFFVISGFFFWWVFPQTESVEMFGFRLLTSKSGRKSPMPKALGIVLVAIPVVFGVFNVSTSMGKFYAFKLASKALPIYSQIAFPEALIEFDLPGRSSSIAAFESELKSIRRYFWTETCPQLNQTVIDNSEDQKEESKPTNFELLRTHFLRGNGTPLPILIEIYRTKNSIYLTTVMDTEKEEHFTLRVSPNEFGITRTQIVLKSEAETVDESDRTSDEEFAELCKGVFAQQ